MSSLRTTAFGGAGREAGVPSLDLQAEKHSSEFDPPLHRRALVVFGGRCGVWWLRWLKPGFRHCFAAVDDGTQWLTVDPLLHRLEIRASGLASDFDLAAAYRDMNLVVIEVVPSAVRRRAAPIGVFTCVETVKRLLGLRAAWVITPWQLFRLIQRRNGRRIGRNRDNRTKQENILDTLIGLI